MSDTTVQIPTLRSLCIGFMCFEGIHAENITTAASIFGHPLSLSKDVVEWMIDWLQTECPCLFKNPIPERPWENALQRYWVEMQLERCLSNSQCTFMVFGHHGVPQRIYKCSSCDPEMGVYVCDSCAKKCHANCKDIVLSTEDEPLTCDCPLRACSPDVYLMMNKKEEGETFMGWQNQKPCMCLYTVHARWSADIHAKIKAF